jgi:hypothetical protein
MKESKALHREAMLMELRQLLSKPKDTDPHKAFGRAERIWRKAAMLGLSKDDEITKLGCDYVDLVGARFAGWDEKLHQEVDQQIAAHFEAQQKKLLENLATMVASGEVKNPQLSAGGSAKLRAWLRDAKANRLALADPRVVSILNDIEGTRKCILEENERRRQEYLKEQQEFKARQPWWLRWLS